MSLYSRGNHLVKGHGLLTLRSIVCFPSGYTDLHLLALATASSLHILPSLGFVIVVLINTSL